MSEHWIRLRGGWEWQTGSADAPIKRPVALPIAWPADQPSPVRLRRRFGCPPIDPRHESVSLRLEQVPGLLAVELNGHTLDGPLDESMTVPLGPGSLGPLLAKNVLILEVDPVRATRPGETWGQIALIVDALTGDQERSAKTP
ncbi:hypothetical protein SAMN05444166_6159 [Singulisphaera sp. GP187]|uniref:hypothetical protein n=1 Tax=Singulisphaera sp. GP187 TaxID=1882752 RepID=UPI000926192D|nr:hypothetical protein [Singulisphaera sp. GP187]SIO59749.1 hypothetical protein SAMN05444166_6159 [Singulisphaera sp. GP187]